MMAVAVLMRIETVPGSVMALRPRMLADAVRMIERLRWRM